MTIPKHHPIYVVRLPNNEGCGHQHSHRAQAWNCAENIARKRENLPFIEVVKLSIRAGNLREQVVGRVTEYHTCKECGGLVFTMGENDERGHYEDCKLSTVVSA